MVDRQPEKLFESLGAIRSGTFETPFRLYSIKDDKLLIHFVDFATFINESLPTGFFSKLSDKAEQKQVKLIHLWEDVWKRDTDLVKDRILNMMGSRERIHARQTEVTRLDKQTAVSFLNRNHLQGTTSAYYKFGLRYDNEIVAAATFSKSRTMYDGPAYYRSYELERFASKRGITVTGGLGKLLEHFIKLQDPAHLMTYADRDWGSGSGYKKLGFLRQEISEPQSFLVNLHTMERIYVSAHKPAGHLENDKDHIRIFNSGSTRYILDRRK